MTQVSSMVLALALVLTLPCSLASTSVAAASPAVHPGQDGVGIMGDSSGKAHNLSFEASSASSGPGWVLLRRPFPVETAEEVAKRRAFISQIAKAHRQAYILKHQAANGTVAASVSASPTAPASALTSNPSSPSKAIVAKVNKGGGDGGFKRIGRKLKRRPNNGSGSRLPSDGRHRLAEKRAWKKMFRKFWKWLVVRRKKRKRKRRQMRLRQNSRAFGRKAFRGNKMTTEVDIVGQGQRQGSASVTMDQQRIKDRDLMLRTFARLKE